MAISSDIIKKLALYEVYAVAVIVMVINHVGLCFMPDATWHMALSRPFAMIWLIPVGYNAGFPLTKRIWYCAFVLFAADVMLGYDPAPLSILASIIAVRLCINPVMEFALRSRAHFFFVHIAVLALAWPSEQVFDYGTLAFLLAAAGWALRNKDDAGKIIDLRLYFALVTLVYIVLQEIRFGFGAVEFTFATASCILAAVLIFHIRDLLREDLRRRPADMIARSCHFIGHNSMEIYTVHILMINIAYWYIFTYG